VVRLKTAFGSSVSSLGFLVTACAAVTEEVVSADLDAVVGRSPASSLVTTTIYRSWSKTLWQNDLSPGTTQ